MTKKIPAAVLKRAATRYVESDDGCWISTYSVSTHGYAQIGWYDRELGRSVMVLAHRAAFEYFTGVRIPAGATVDHLCHERRCVNPAHMRLLSNSENAKRNSPDGDFPLGWLCKKNHSQEHRRMRRRKNRRGEIVEFPTCGQCMRDSQARYLAKKGRAR